MRLSLRAKLACLAIASLLAFGGEIQAEPTYEPSVETSPQEAFEILNGFVGDWSGTFILTDEAGNILQLIPLTQSYHWDGNTMKGRAVFGSEDRIDHASSETSIEHGTITAVIREGTRSKVMKATPIENGLIWTPRDPTRIKSEQSTELVTQKEGKDILVIEGFELISNPPLLQKVLFRAELVKQTGSQ